MKISEQPISEWTTDETTEIAAAIIADELLFHVEQKREKAAKKMKEQTQELSNEYIKSIDRLKQEIGTLEQVKSDVKDKFDRLESLRQRTKVFVRGFACLLLCIVVLMLAYRSWPFIHKGWDELEPLTWLFGIIAIAVAFFFKSFLKTQLDSMFNYIKYKLKIFEDIILDSIFLKKQESNTLELIEVDKEIKDKEKDFNETRFRLEQLE